MFFKVNKSVQDLIDWLAYFQHIVEKEEVNQHLRSIVEIWTNNTNLPPSEKKYKVQIVANNKFPFLDMKMSFSPKGDLQFGVFIHKGQKFMYIGKGITHTPGTLHAIPSGVLNRLDKLTSHKLNFHSESVDSFHPDHSNSLHKAGLAPPIFLKMEELVKGQDGKTNIDMEKEPEINKKKNRNVYFCVAYSRYFLRICTV